MVQLLEYLASVKIELRGDKWPAWDKNVIYGVNRVLP